MQLQFVIFTYYLIIVSRVYGYFELCDHQIQLNANEKIYINSPYYPSKYPSGSSCRYFVLAPIDYQITFSCQLNFDKTGSSCSTEQFYFMEQASLSLVGSEYFCGSGNITRKSLYNQASIAYTSTSTQDFGGTFSCLAEVIQKSCTCGWNRSFKIAGGVDASISEFPSMAGIINNDLNRLVCGAAIIHRRYLLSTAHCYSNQNVSKLRVLVGFDGDITKLDRNCTKNLEYQIEALIKHTAFNPRNLRNDIALIRTVREIQWSSFVGPACLPFSMLRQNLLGAKLETAGWGTLSYGGELAKHLRKTTLDVISDSECRRQIPSLGAGQVCTFTRGQDTCQFDSGGGHYYRDQRTFLVALTSYGFGCATSTPSINTRISTYLPWIQENTAASAAEFCIQNN